MPANNPCDDSLWKKMKRVVDEKQVVFFSEKYAKRARVKREAVKQKAGKILTSSSVLEIDTEKIKKEVALDGYYLIVTSEMEGSDDRIIEFVALTISILLELKTEHRYSIGKLLDSMARSNCIYLKDNLYLFCYYDETLELLSQKTGIKFNHKMLSLGEIKKNIRKYKKEVIINFVQTHKAPNTMYLVMLGAVLNVCSVKLKI